jgi:hypothetical protein
MAIACIAVRPRAASCGARDSFTYDHVNFAGGEKTQNLADIVALKFTNPTPQFRSPSAAVAGAGEAAVNTAGAGGWAAAGAACTSVIGVGAALLWGSGLMAAVTDAVVFTGSAAATRNCCAEDRIALVSKAAHAQMSLLVGVDIGLRLGCVDFAMVKAGTRPAPSALSGGTALRSAVKKRHEISSP